MFSTPKRREKLFKIKNGLDEKRNYRSRRQLYCALRSKKNRRLTTVELQQENLKRRLHFCPKNTIIGQLETGKMFSGQMNQNLRFSVQKESVCSSTKGGSFFLIALSSPLNIVELVLSDTVR